MGMKTLKFVGSSLEDLRNFPYETRRTAGFELRAVQRGLDPSDWKPIETVGPGAKEIRIRVLGEWRVIYVAKFRDAIYVLIRIRRRVEKRAGKILNWRADDTNRLGDNQ